MNTTIGVDNDTNSDFFTDAPVPGSDDEPVLFRLAKAVVPAFGIIGNIVFMSFICQNQVGTYISNLLLKIQTSLDGMITTMAVVMLMETKFWHTGNHTFDHLVCRIWHSQMIYWYFVHMSVYILLQTAVDRFIFVVFPFSYRKRKPSHIYIPSLILAIPGVAYVGPMLIESFFDEETGQCIPGSEILIARYPWLKYIRNAFAASWFAIDYVGPALLIIIIYTVIIVKLKASLSAENESTQNVSNRFTIATFVISLLLICSLSVDAIYYFLLTFGFIKVNYFGNIAQKLGVLFSTFNSVVNPFVYIILLPNFRHFVLNGCSCNEPKKLNYSTNGNKISLSAHKE